jgi:hypothetical protein
MYFLIVDKETITHQDIVRAKILSDMLNTVSTINEYYNAAPSKHISPELQIYEDRSVYLDGKTEDVRIIYKNEDMSPHQHKQ